MNSEPVIASAAARVLIVDDERVNRELLEVMLTPEGYVLLTAASGEEAIAATLQHQPDLILLDVMMPGMDGYQVVHKLKSDPATTNIPIILVTALNHRKARMLGLNAGAEEFLSKPVDRAELQVRVRNLLRLKAYSDHHRKHGLMLEGQVSSRTAELVESEKRYRQIVESTTDGILKVDVAATIIFLNRRLAKMLGYEVDELLGKSALSLLPTGQVDGIAKPALKRRSEGVTETYDLTFRRKDGAELSVSIASTPILDEHGNFAGALSSIRDVTEQKKLLAQLTVSDRMASIGILAAGVAHEINNPLACVMANLELAEQEVLELGEKLGVAREFGEVTEEIRDSCEATKRIRDIVRDLKIFSRGEDDTPGPVDVQRVMESSLRMVWNEIRHRAKLVKNYGVIPPVEATESRLGQVFLNLVVNAVQAIDEGRAEDNEIRITTSLDSKGDVIIEIADTGPGMPPEIVCQLFTPFFTTKPAGIGTGLGLSICHRIVTGFNGSIEIISEVGNGTAFRITLPPARAEMRRRIPQVAETPTARRRGTILVVDNEPMIAKVVQRSLSPDHEVVAISSATEALERIGAGERFDVILCDLMMPQMTGMDLHAELSEIAREQAGRMIFLTGGAFTSRARSFLDETRNRHIEKPFDVLHLRALVNEHFQ